NEKELKPPLPSEGHIRNSLLSQEAKDKIVKPLGNFSESGIKIILVDRQRSAKMDSDKYQDSRDNIQEEKPGAIDTSQVGIFNEPYFQEIMSEKSTINTDNVDTGHKITQKISVKEKGLNLDNEIEEARPSYSILNAGYLKQEGKKDDQNSNIHGQVRAKAKRTEPMVIKIMDNISDAVPEFAPGDPDGGAPS